MMHDERLLAIVSQLVNWPTCPKFFRVGQDELPAETAVGIVEVRQKCPSLINGQAVSRENIRDGYVAATSNV